MHIRHTVISWSNQQSMGGQYNICCFQFLRAFSLYPIKPGNQGELLFFFFSGTQFSLEAGVNYYYFFAGIKFSLDARVNCFAFSLDPI